MKSEFLLILLFLDILFFLGLPGLAWVLRVVASFSERNSVFSIASSSNIHCSFDFSPSFVLTLCMASYRGLGQVMSSFSPLKFDYFSRLRDARKKLKLNFFVLGR